MDFFGIFTEMIILIRDQSSYDSTGQKKVSWIAGQLLLCLKPFVVFFNLVEDWSWENRLERLLLNSPGLLDSISS